LEGLVMPEKTLNKIIAENRQARHEYFVIEALEAGIELIGTEVKSIRCGGANLKDSWCEIKDGEIFVNGMHISPYEKGNIFNRDPRRVRRLLIHKSEIRRLFDKVRQDGLTLVPLKLYFKGSRVKMELGLCKGKKLYDKRDDMAKRQSQRDIERAMKDRSRA
jgi:SsrA-binding protein